MDYEASIKEGLTTAFVIAVVGGSLVATIGGGIIAIVWLGKYVGAW